MLQGAENLKEYTQGFINAYDDDLISNTNAKAPRRLFINSEVRPFDFPSSALVNNTRVLEAMFADPRSSTAGSDLNNDGVGDNLVPMGSPSAKTLAQWRAEADTAYTNVTYNIPFPPASIVDYRWIAIAGPDLGWIRNEYTLGDWRNAGVNLWYERLWQITLDGVLAHAIYKPVALIRNRTPVPTNGKSWADTKVGNYLHVQLDSGSGLSPLSSNATGRGRMFNYGWHFNNTVGKADGSSSDATRALSAEPKRSGPVGRFEVRNFGNYPYYVTSGRRSIYTAGATSGDFGDLEFYGVQQVHRQPNLYRPPVGGSFGYYEDDSTGACPHPTLSCFATQEHYIEAAVRIARYATESALNSVGNSTDNLSYWLGMVGYETDSNIPTVTIDYNRQLMSMLRAKQCKEIKFFGNAAGFANSYASRQDWDHVRESYYDVFNPQLVLSSVAIGQSPGSTYDELEALRRTTHSDDPAADTIKIFSQPVDSVDQAGLKLTFENLEEPDSYDVMRVVYEGWNLALNSVPMDGITVRMYARTSEEEYKELQVDDCVYGGPCDGSFGFYSPDRSTRRIFDFRASDGYDLPDWVLPDGSITIKIIHLGPEPFTAFFDHVQLYIFPEDATYNATVAAGQSNAQSSGFAPPQGGDVNHDGYVTGGDFVAFFDAYENQVKVADVNGDDSVDEDDVTLFLSYFGG